MSLLDRRSVLRSLMGAAALIPVVGGFVVPSKGRNKKDPLWMEGIGLMRLINTAEFRQKRATGRYVEPWLLASAVLAARDLQVTGPTGLPFDSIHRTIGSFAVFWVAPPDGSGYEVSLVHRPSGFALLSDEVGEIFSGEARSHEKLGAAPSLRDQLAFEGTSIGPGTGTSVLAAVAGFFAPTLRASAPKCCNGSGCTCASTAGDCPGGSSACNIGTGGSCNWCCQAQSNCQYCVPDGC